MNNDQGKKQCESVLTKEFSVIDKKLRMNEYKTFGDFEADTNLFYSFFMEKGAEFPNKERNLLEFLNASIKRAANTFLKDSEKEVEIQKTLAK